MSSLDSEPIPLVIVEGFLSGAGAVIWGNFEEHSNYACQSNGERNRRTIFATVGPVSSLHDRACELFYSLVGGTVDYGSEHSRANSHGRYGRTYETGLYPEWSVDRPLHFLGHSIGGPTIVKLQWLLSTGFFGTAYSPDMIVSLTTISAPFRGTQLVYSLGEDPHDAPAVRRFSPGDILSKAVHIAAYLAPVLPRFLDLHADARALSFRDASFRSFLGQLRKSGWAESRDATPYDVTFDAAEEREARGEGEVNPNTFYRSYCATLSMPSESARSFVGSCVSALSSWPFYLSSAVMARFDFSSLRPVPVFLSTAAAVPKQGPQPNNGEATVEDAVMHGDRLSAALRENDGVVPLFSQWHPRECRNARCRHFNPGAGCGDGVYDEGAKARHSGVPEAGVWNVHHLADAHHFSVVPFWLGSAIQKAFWLDLGHWLRAVDRTPRAGALGGEKGQPEVDEIVGD
ncbi:alpha/beta-hydrolase [Lenzites betulinus]|nr:alpha/beta-hydrolase [Lenzites betulinus]